MKRREFITLLGGAIAWPLAARAQQGERMRRIGVLINVVSDEQDSLGRLSAFRQALQQLGWRDGGNVRIETRVAKGNPKRLRSDSA
jgi:putative tryptophan/tyrosine transport system substrate-binding protein